MDARSCRRAHRSCRAGGARTRSVHGCVFAGEILLQPRVLLRGDALGRGGPAGVALGVECHEVHRTPVEGVVALGLPGVVAGQVEEIDLRLALIGQVVVVAHDQVRRDLGEERRDRREEVGLELRHGPGLVGVVSEREPELRTRGPHGLADRALLRGAHAEVAHRREVHAAGLRAAGAHEGAGLRRHATGLDLVAVGGGRREAGERHAVLATGRRGGGAALEGAALNAVADDRIAAGRVQLEGDDGAVGAHVLDVGTARELGGSGDGAHGECGDQRQQGGTRHETSMARRVGLSRCNAAPAHHSFPSRLLALPGLQAAGRERDRVGRRDHSGFTSWAVSSSSRSPSSLTFPTPGTSQ